MIIDAKTITTGTIIETDVCIVGAGPAGLTLAREFAGQNFRVCLLESGGLEPDRQTQSLLEGEIRSRHRYPADELVAGRGQQIGGSANLWCIQVDPTEKQAHVRHVVPDAIDFEAREDIPYSGWCVTRSELEPYYKRAHAICQIGAYDYSAQFWQEEQAKPLPLKGDRLQSSVFQFGARAAFTESRQELDRASNITTYVNAHVLAIDTTEAANQVTQCRVASHPGQEFVVNARIFVLAGGGFENARLLLLSNQAQPNGLGNQHDLVGRFFMDHPGFRIGVLIPGDRSLFESTAFYDLRRVQGTAVMGKLSLSEEILRREKMLNLAVMLVPRPKGYESKAVRSWRSLTSSLKKLQLPKDALNHLGTIVSEADNLAAYFYRRLRKQAFVYSPRYGGWSRRPADQKQFQVFEVIAQAEQAPHPDNRVTLSQERDRFGRPQVRLDWQWSAIDLASIRRFQEIFQDEIKASGIGTFQSREALEGGNPRFGSTHHHMGTTRMHPDPTQGVVDRNCQVHGISNLFIAGSSVFPTGGGYANPTLTIVALATRLADHIKSQLSS